MPRHVVSDTLPHFMVSIQYRWQNDRQMAMLEFRAINQDNYKMFDYLSDNYIIDSHTMRDILNNDDDLSCDLEELVTTLVDANDPIVSLVVDSKITAEQVINYYQKNESCPCNSAGSCVSYICIITMLIVIFITW